MRPEPRRTFHWLHPTLVSPIAVCRELDPRSLDPAALFGARMSSLFEVRRRLETSATALSTCGQPNRGLSTPRRDDGLDHLPFRTHHAALSSSDARRAALRPPQRPRCWFLLVTQVCPTAMPKVRPTIGGLTRRCVVRIDEHGSKDRAKDASRYACDGVPCLRPAPTP
jgi:hypothetical protein